MSEPDPDSYLSKTTAALIKKAINGVHEYFNAEAVVKRMIKQMRTDEAAAVWTMMGMEKKYGAWEVERPPKPGEVSPLFKMICDTAEPTLKAAIDKHMAPVLATLPSTIDRALPKAIRETIDWKVHSMVREAKNTLERQIEIHAKEAVAAGLKSVEDEIRQRIYYELGLVPPVKTDLTKENN